MIRRILNHFTAIGLMLLISWIVLPTLAALILMHRDQIDAYVTGLVFTYPIPIATFLFSFGGWLCYKIAKNKH